MVIKMNAVEIRNLTKIYKGFLLDNLNLTLPSGCIMGLIGENGAGKSTTIKLILDIIKNDGGTVNIFGKNNVSNITELKEDIGVVTDEIGFPECLNAKQINKIMKLTFKNWDEQYYFDLLGKMNVPSDKAFKKFSRGTKMKLGIAVAMSHKPKLLLLDEPTSGLDPVVRDEVVELFSEFTRDETHSVLISSHIVSDLEKICDYIAFLHRGKLMLCEEKDALYSDFGMVHCTGEQLRELDPSAVIGKKETPYGVNVLVRRNAVPSGLVISPVNIEELFIFMVKEGR